MDAQAASGRQYPSTAPIARSGEGDSPGRRQTHSQITSRGDHERSGPAEPPGTGTGQYGRAGLAHLRVPDGLSSEARRPKPWWHGGGAPADLLGFPCKAEAGFNGTKGPARLGRGDTSGAETNRGWSRWPTPSNTGVHRVGSLVGSACCGRRSFLRGCSWRPLGTGTETPIPTTFPRQPSRSLHEPCTLPTSRPTETPAKIPPVSLPGQLSDYDTAVASPSVSCIGAVLPFPVEVRQKGAPMDTPDRPPAPSLVEEQRELTRARIRRAAMEVVARRGFDATVNEIALQSGVSPRTVFRHYVSHDRLIAETVRDMFEASGRYPDVDSPRDVDDLAAWIDSLPQQIADVDRWLEALAVTIHTRMAEVFGTAFWDIYAPPRSGSEALAEVAELCRVYRLRGMHYMAALAWRSAGGAGEPPADLTLAFALHLSAHATQALMADFDQTPAQIGALTADILKVLVRRAVEAQGSDGG
jgi:AcrR family transcriptional regulator